MSNGYKNSPLWWWFTVVAGFAALGYWALDAQTGGQARSLLVILGFVHIVEAFYALILAQRNGLSKVALLWFGHTLVCGFMAIILLKKTIREQTAS